MNVLSLFSGIGGIELGLERAGMTTVGQVEIDPFCRQVLARHWPNVPRHDDVRTAVQWWESEPRPHVHVIAGGFPCQDVSNAGGKAGIDGVKSSLWAAMADTIRDIRPRYVIVENVAALLIRGIGRVLSDLHTLGFDAEWSVVSACSLGAPHTRERLFLLAHANDERQQAGWPHGIRDDQALAVWREWDSEHLYAATESRCSEGESHWSTEPEVDRMADGLSDELDRRRLFALGNAVVPAVAEHIGRRLIERTAA